MLRSVILCLLLQSALFSSINNNYDRNSVKGVMKQPLKSPKSTPTFPKSLDASLKTRGEPLFNYGVNGRPVILKNTRQPRILIWFKQLLNTTVPHHDSERFKNRNTRALEVKVQTARLINALNELSRNLKIISHNIYLTLRVHFETEPKFREKRSVYNTYGNDTTKISTNIIHNNVTAPINSSVLADNLTTFHSRYNDSNNSAMAHNGLNNELTLSEPIFLNPNASSNKGLELSGRRFDIPIELLRREKDIMPTNLKAMIKDIEHRILPLTNVKIQLADDYSYRIGYIIANIDTLQNQLSKLKIEMTLKQDLTSLKKLFQKIKSADAVISNLLHILISYDTMSLLTLAKKFG